MSRRRARNHAGAKQLISAAPALLLLVWLTVAKMTTCTGTVDSKNG
jgi:hypothetical protein